MIDKKIPGERWKKLIVKGIDFDGKYYVSDHGRVKSFTYDKSGTIIKGSQTEGYSSFFIRYFKKRSRKEESYIKSLKKAVDALQKTIRDDKKKLTTLKRNSDPYRSLSARIKKSEEKYKADHKKYAAVLASSDKARVLGIGFLTHKVIAENFIKRPSAEHKFVVHLDHKKLNNHYKNLKWATQYEVTHHHDTNPVVIKARKNLVKFSKENIISKLTIAEVKKIKQGLKQGKTLRSLASKYGVSDMQVHRIKTGECWGNIKI